jgi:hypothetical protein
MNYDSDRAKSGNKPSVRGLSCALAALVLSGGALALLVLGAHAVVRG